MVQWSCRLVRHLWLGQHQLSESKIFVGVTLREINILFKEILVHLPVDELLTNPDLIRCAKSWETTLWHLRWSNKKSLEFAFDKLVNSIPSRERKRNQDLNQTIAILRTKIKKLA
jgi:hypothetical protein